jgi:hypothetical protein
VRFFRWESTMAMLAMRVTCCDAHWRGAIRVMGQALCWCFEPHVSRDNARVRGELLPLVQHHGDACNEARRSATRVGVLRFAEWVRHYAGAMNHTLHAATRASDANDKPPRARRCVCSGFRHQHQPQLEQGPA